MRIHHPHHAKQYADCCQITTAEQNRIILMLLIYILAKIYNIVHLPCNDSAFRKRTIYVYAFYHVICNISHTKRKTRMRISPGIVVIRHLYIEVPVCTVKSVKAVYAGSRSHPGKKRSLRAKQENSVVILVAAVIRRNINAPQIIRAHGCRRISWYIDRSVYLSFQQIINCALLPVYDIQLFSCAVRTGNP